MPDLKDIGVLDVAPSSVAGDDQIKAMAAGIDPAAKAVTDSIPEIEILKNIDQLPESILRMLAWENRVYGAEWQLAATVENRRALVKDSFELNRRRGTRWSIERVLDLVGLDASIQEWFEYDGSPYFFKININSLQGESLTEDQLATANRMIDEYKPLRCKVETIDFTLDLDDPAVSWIGAANTMSGVLETLSFNQDLLLSEAEIKTGTAKTFSMKVDVYPE